MKSLPLQNPAEQYNNTLDRGINIDDTTGTSTDTFAHQDQCEAVEVPSPSSELTPPPKKITEQHLLLKAVACSSTDFLQKKLSVPEVLIGCFRLPSLSMVYAKAGVGKTWIIHNIALCLTRKDYANVCIGSWPVEKPCGVLLIDGELPKGEIQNRLKLMSLELGQESTDNPLTVISSEDMAGISDGTINLTEKKWRDGIADFVTERPEHKLIIFDNISSLAPGINENTKQDWDPINQWLLSLRRKGFAVILLHHASKSGSDRGHSGRIDNLDNVIFLENDSEYTEGLRIKVKFEKGRYLTPDQKEPFTLELVPGPKGGLIMREATSGVLQAERLKELVKLLQINESQKNIGIKLGLCQSRVSQLKKEAQDTGYILEDGTLTPKGKEWIGDGSCSDISISRLSPGD